MRQSSESIYLQLSAIALSLGEKAIRQEIALQLYAKRIFAFGQALCLAQTSVWEFQQLLGQNKIPRHYNETDLAADLETIRTGF